jgi:CubicO group peptidase (beta-lactamase class C family)
LISSPLQALLEEGAAQGIFPSARAVVIREGRTVFDGGVSALPETRYDLASLTKVMATTAVFLHLWDEGHLSPTTRLDRLLPGAAAAAGGTTLADLLYHRSGLPAFEPLFAAALRAHPELTAACPSSVRAAARAEVVAAAQALPQVTPRGQTMVYSDVGFIVLGEALAAAAQQPLDAFFVEHVASPLELIAHFRRLSAAQPDEPCAETGQTRPREPAPGQESLWEPLAAGPARGGEVDDDNAWAMDGVAGHAGLFGTARDVAHFGQAVLEELDGANRLASASFWQRALAVDRQTSGSTRAMGFDTPSPPGSAEMSAAGRLMAGSTAVGHTGFTGTSLWVDLPRRLSVALCTNRTLFGRANVAIRAFRPRFHDAVVESLGP